MKKSKKIKLTSRQLSVLTDLARSGPETDDYVRIFVRRCLTMEQLQAKGFAIFEKRRWHATGAGSNRVDEEVDSKHRRETDHD